MTFSPVLQQHCCNLYTLQMTFYGINQRTFWCEQPKHVSFTRSHCQKSVNAWKNFDMRNHTQSRNFHQIHLKMLPTKFQNQWLSSSTNLYSQLQFQTSENIKSYTTLWIRFKSDFSNYHPIFVLPCLSKVLEQVVHDQLSNYLEKHYLLKSSEFTFHPSRSTELACNLLVDDIRKNIDNGLLTEVIQLDLSKAFDTVSHLYLLPKLPSYGISGNEFTWFENCLFNRRYDVFYDGHLSKAFTVFRGVPQWLILGFPCDSTWTTLITVHAILVLSSMLTIC